MVIKLTKELFEEKISSLGGEFKFIGQSPAMIKFEAEWCGPCKMIAPIIEELAEEYNGKIDVYKLDTDDQQELAGAFGIQSIPSILFIPVEGQPTMAQGAMPKEKFVEIIEDVFKL